jgi:RHS repeat-associated protein
MTIATDQVKGGFYSIKAMNKTDDWESFYQSVFLNNLGYPFVASVYIKTQQLVNGIRFCIDFYQGETYLGSESSNLLMGNNNWKQLILRIDWNDIPQGTDRMNIYVRKYAGTGTAWIDCFRLESGSAPTPKETKYIYVNNTHLAKIDALGDYYFYVCDALGSPIKILDADGDVVKEETFKAFGEELISSGNYMDNHRFTGKEYENSDVYYFGARYYDPLLGRFLNPDPAKATDYEDPSTFNPYIYCGNNPLRFIDPDGMWWQDISSGKKLSDREAQNAVRQATWSTLKGEKATVPVKWISTLETASASSPKSVLEEGEIDVIHTPGAHIICEGPMVASPEGPVSQEVIWIADFYGDNLMIEFKQQRTIGKNTTGEVLHEFEWSAITSNKDGLPVGYSVRRIRGSVTELNKRLDEAGVKYKYDEKRQEYDFQLND